MACAPHGGGRPPYGYRLVDAGPHPNTAQAAWGRRLQRLDLDPATADELELQLSRIQTGPFDLALDGVGAFGEGEKTRSIHARVAEPNAELERLAAKCETAARRVGLKIEARVFRPHLTLAYLRGSPTDRLTAWLAGHNLLKSPPWRADHFCLYSSWSGPDGWTAPLSSSPTMPNWRGAPMPERG